MRNKIDINKLLDVPLYLQLKDSLKGEILSGAYKEDEQLPTEEVICRFYNISRPVVRKAYQALIDEGLVVRRQGSGTFVKHNLVLTNIFFRTHFSETLLEHGIQPSSRILSLEVVHKDSVEALRDEIYDNYYLVKRVRYGNNIPLFLEQFYFPIEVFPDIKDDLRNDMSFTDVITKKYQIGSLESVTQLNALVMDEGLALLFGVPKGSAALKFTFFNRYADGSLCFHKITFSPGKRHRIELEVTPS